MLSPGSANLAEWIISVTSTEVVWFVFVMSISTSLGGIHRICSSRCRRVFLVGPLVGWCTCTVQSHVEVRS